MDGYKAIYNTFNVAKSSRAALNFTNTIEKNITLNFLKRSR